MNKIATVTSKRQITIPVALYRRAGFSDRQRLVVTEDSGKIILSSANHLINELSGSLKMPKEWNDKNLDQIIESSKKEYFAKQ